MVEWASQDPGRFGWSRGREADIIPFVFHGHRFPAGVARLAVPLFEQALDILCRQPGFALPESPGLDAGMWGYEDRKIRGSDRWSFHAYGLAIDVAAPWNPMGTDPPRASRHRLPPNTAELVYDLGISWGGSWGGRADWMHLELHATPTEAVALSHSAGHSGGTSSLGTRRQPFPLPAGFYYGPYEGPKESVSGQGREDGPYREGLRAAQIELGTTPDGIYGPRTAAAVRVFQHQHGLVVDGLIGPRTWAALQV